MQTKTPPSWRGFLNTKRIVGYPQQDMSQQLPSHLVLSQWSISQQVVSDTHSDFDSQHDISDDVVQPNNPIVKITNKFFILFFYYKYKFYAVKTQT